MDANSFYRGLLGVNDEPSGIGLLDPTDVQRRNAINQGLLAMGASIANASGAQRLPVSTGQVVSGGLLAGNTGYNAGIKTAYDQQKENVMNNAALQNYHKQNMILDFAQRYMSDPNYGAQPQYSNVGQGTVLAPGMPGAPQGLLPLTEQQRNAKIGQGMGLLGMPGAAAFLTGSEQLHPKMEALRPNTSGRDPYTGVQIAYNPEPPPGYTYNPATNSFEPINNYGAAITSNIQTKEAAEAPYKFVDRYDPVIKQTFKVPMSSVTPPAPIAPPLSIPQSQTQLTPPPQPSAPLNIPQPGTQLTPPQRQPLGAPPLDPPIVRRMQPDPQIIGQNLTGSQGGFPMVGRDQAVPARGLSGFPSGPALSESTEQKGIGEANAGVYKNVLAQGAAGHETMNSVALLDSLYKDGLNTGNYTPLLTKAASLAKSAGMDPGSFMLSDPKNATVYEKTILSTFH